MRMDGIGPQERVAKVRILDGMYFNEKPQRTGIPCGSMHRHSLD